VIILIAALAVAVVSPFVVARVDPWRPCACQGRKCGRCRWVGKRPRVAALLVRRDKLREEGWLK
jgi:hypothetical protein